MYDPVFLPSYVHKRNSSTIPFFSKFGDTISQPTRPFHGERFTQKKIDGEYRKGWSQNGPVGDFYHFIFSSSRTLKLFPWAIGNDQNDTRTPQNNLVCGSQHGLFGYVGSDSAGYPISYILTPAPQNLILRIQTIHVGYHILGYFERCGCRSRRFLLLTGTASGSGKMKK